VKGIRDDQTERAFALKTRDAHNSIQLQCHIVLISFQNKTY